VQHAVAEATQARGARRDVAADEGAHEHAAGIPRRGGDRGRLRVGPVAEVKDGQAERQAHDHEQQMEGDADGHAGEDRAPTDGIEEGAPGDSVLERGLHEVSLLVERAAPATRARR